MYNIIAILLIALFGSITYGLGAYNTDFGLIGIMILVISGVYLFISFLSTFSYYSSQLNRFEKLHSDINNLSTDIESKNSLIKDLKLYLGEKYPNIEKEIFENLSNSNVSAILSYPEIKSASTIKDLISQMAKIEYNIRYSKKGIENSCAWIRYYNKSKWEYFTPKIPNILYDVIFNEMKPFN